MAERRSSTCSVSLSKPLVAAVVLAIMLKVLICIVVVRVLGSQESLVTPGDAVASFISVQDEGTVSGPITQDMVRQRKRTKVMKGAIYSPLKPQKWAEKRSSRAQAIPRGVWIRTYIILLIGFAATVACLQQQISNGTPLGIKLNADEASDILYPVTDASPFLSSVIIANIPQLYLSFWYIVYNALITRRVMSQEWALLSVDYRPLRVTQPNIPLLVLSTLGHWLASNALFVIVSQGYPGPTGDYTKDHTSLPPDAVVAIGQASLPVLKLTILCAMMILWPILLSRKVLPGYMPIVGSNSLAIMAACRVSPLAQVPSEDGHEIGEDTTQVAHQSVDHTPADDTGRDTELEELVRTAETCSEFEEGCGGVGDIALHPLKWGEVKMPEKNGTPRRARIWTTWATSVSLLYLITLSLQCMVAGTDDSDQQGKTWLLFPNKLALATGHTGGITVIIMESSR
ncbi:hypothetical protein CSOJ01_11227 [Colletotrichum sojae]|uniref:Uncharacterized protein n=1 Tax=Colletotrichum sojae TaxID=2175907 RepID=A0A8H6MNZ1_9PEZI|nr:hypothetical protein CSOJ01_11227 [Colletotrichum sojae]